MTWVVVESIRESMAAVILQFRGLGDRDIRCCRVCETLLRDWSVIGNAGWEGRNSLELDDVGRHADRLFAWNLLDSMIACHLQGLRTRMIRDDPLDAKGPVTRVASERIVL